MSESLEDIRKKFRNTFCFLQLNGKKYLAEYTDDNGDNAFYFKSPEFGEILVDKDTIEKCLTHRFPKSGLYNVGGQAVNFVRYPERQWRRAPYRDNCRLISILGHVAVTITPRVIEINLHNLEEVYAEKYPENLDNAIKSMKYSVALNRNLAVSQATSGEKNEYLLWYHVQPVGVINTDARTVEVNFNPLYQEVLDHFRKQEPTWQVTKKQQS